MGRVKRLQTILWLGVAVVGVSLGAGCARFKIATPERPVPAITSQALDNAVIIAFYNTGADSNIWNNKIAAVVSRAFEDARLVTCSLPSDCNQPPVQYPDERWILYIQVDDYLVKRGSGFTAQTMFISVGGTYDLYEYGNRLKSWNFSEIIKMEMSGVGGASPENVKEGEARLAGNVSSMVLENLLPALQSRGIGPAEGEELPQIFLGNIESTRASAEVRGAVKDAILTGMNEIGTHRVLNEADIKAVLGAAAVQQLSGCTEERCSVEIGEQLGADQVLYGSVAVVGNDLQVTFTVVDTQGKTRPKRARRQLPVKLQLIPGAVRSMLRELLR